MKYGCIGRHSVFPIVYQWKPHFGHASKNDYSRTQQKRNWLAYFREMELLHDAGLSNTIRSFIEKGYALASIDYRHSTTAKFPAQIQDCYAALEFLYTNAGKYKLDKNKIALIGFSAGGHLASLLALSNNNSVVDFIQTERKRIFK